MQADVKGTTMPLLEMILDPGESVISTHGDLSWMTANMQLTQTTSTGGQKGLMSGLKRVVGGGGIFLTKYEAQGGQGMVGFGTKLPGRIFEIAIAPGQGYLVHRHGWVCGTDGIVPTVGLQQTFRGALTAGTASSSRGSRARAGPGSSCPARSPPTSWRPGSPCSSTPATSGLFEDRVSFTITRLPGIKNIAFGGDGYHLVSLTGPGNIWLQTHAAAGAGRRPLPRTCPVTIGTTTTGRPTPASAGCSAASSARTSDPARPSERLSQRTLERKVSRSTITRTSLPAATRPALSETERVNTRRRPSIRSRVASAHTIPSDAHRHQVVELDPLGHRRAGSGRWPSMARQLASSHRATSRGVASTGTVPERKASAVSASVTSSSMRADRPVCGATPVRYVTEADVGHRAPASPARRPT